jgi:CDP-diglyceride synthetase
MLKQRLITAAILIPIVVWAILALPSQIILLLFTAVAGLAAWEWLALINIKSTINKLLCLSLVLAAGLAMGFFCFAANRVIHVRLGLAIGDAVGDGLCSQKIAHHADTVIPV